MSLWTEVQKGGRVTIPANLRKEYGLSEGDMVNLTLVDGEIRICSWKKNLERIQEMVKGRIPPGVSIVDELIAERRKEAAKENEEYERSINDETQSNNL